MDRIKTLEKDSIRKSTSTPSFAELELKGEPILEAKSNVELNTVNGDKLINAMRLDINELETHIMSSLKKAGEDANSIRKQMETLNKSSEKTSDSLKDVELICKEIGNTFNTIIDLHKTSGCSAGGFRSLLIAFYNTLHEMIEDMEKSKAELSKRSSDENGSMRSKSDETGGNENINPESPLRAKSDDISNQKNAIGEKSLDSRPPMIRKRSKDDGELYIQSRRSSMRSTTRSNLIVDSTADKKTLERPSPLGGLTRVNNAKSDNPASPASSSGSSGTIPRLKRRMSMNIPLTSLFQSSSNVAGSSSPPASSVPASSPAGSSVSANSSDASSDSASLRKKEKESSIAKKLRKKLKPHLYLLRVLNEKMRLITTLYRKEAPNGRFTMGLGTFSDIDEIFKLNPPLTAHTIHSNYHLGFEYDPNLKEYVKKLKIVYCAANESLKAPKGMKMMMFNKAGAKYLDEKKAITMYAQLRQNMDIMLLREVFNLMEDPVIRFFASQFGMAPKTHRVGTDQSITISTRISPYLPEKGCSSKEKVIIKVRCRLIAATKYKVSDQIKGRQKEDEDIDNEETGKKGESLVQMMHHEMDLKRETQDHDKEKLPHSVSIEDGLDDIENTPSPNHNSEDINFDINSNNLNAKTSLEKIKKKKSVTHFVMKKTASTLNLGRKSVNVRRGQDFEIDSQDTDLPEDLENVIILHFHGGGFISQSPETHKCYLDIWARETGIPIVSVDYALSPENIFPVAVDQCFGVYKWLLNHDNISLLGIPMDRSKAVKIIVTGDSAGGNLTCAVTTRAILEGYPKPIGIMLTYPATNLASAGSVSRLIYMNDPLLNYQTMNIVLDCYLGQHKVYADVDPLISPIVASNEVISNYPVTVITTGDVDPLVDDSAFLFERLRQNNVPALMKVYQGLPHGYLNVPSQIPKAWPSVHEAASYLRWIVRKSNGSPSVPFNPLVISSNSPTISPSVSFTKK